MARQEKETPEGVQEPIEVRRDIRTIDIPLFERAASLMARNGLGNVSLLVL